MTGGWVETEWWRVLLGKGRIWIETADEEEAREALATAPGGGRLERMQRMSEHRWVAAP